MARRGRKRREEPTYETFWVIEKMNGPDGPEHLSMSVKEPRLTQRCRGLGPAQATQWFVDGLPVASREAARAALLLPLPPGTEPPKLPEPSPEWREALNRFIRALAVADAHRDHEAEMAERAKAARPLNGT